MATIDTILNIRVEGTDSMVKLKTAIDSTSKELKELKKGAKAAGADQEKFNAKIITAETKLKGLRGELNKSKTDLIKNAKAAGDTSKSYDSLTKQNAALSASLRKLSDPLGKNRKEFDNLSNKIKTNTDTLKKMDAQMGRNQRNVGNYKQAIAGVATTVGAAIIAFKAFQRVLGTFVEFEFQMKQVGVISGATSDELLILSDSAKELGATTAFTAGEVAGLQKSLAKLGFDPTEIEAMTAATLDLAFAFGDDLDETATQVGVVLKSFKLEASETGRVTDVLAKAFSSSALDLQKFSVSFPKVGAIAKQVGFSLEGTTALLGALTDAGLEASTAGTSLKNIFLLLADSNSALSQELGEGVNSVDTLLPALKDLFDSGIDVEEMLNLTDKRAVTAFATIASGTDDVSNLNTELVNAEGTAKEFADVMRDSLKGSLDEASSAADGFIINLLEKLAPAITFIVDGVALLFKGLGLLVNNFGKVALAVGAYGVVMAATAISQGVFTTGLGIARLSIVSYIKSTRIAEVVTKAFSAALRTNPIGLLVGGLTLAVASLVSFNNESKETVKGLGDINTEALELSDSLETMGNRYDELTSKTELSKEEQTELDKIIKDIAKNVPDAVTEVDKYGAALAVNTEKIEEFNKQNGKIATLKAEINIKNQTAALSEQREELEKVNKVNEEGNAVYVKNIGLVEKVDGLLQKVTLTTSKSGNVTSTANKLNKEQQLIYAEYIKGLESGAKKLKEDIENNEDIIASINGVKNARQLDAESKAKATEKLKAEILLKEQEIRNVENLQAKIKDLRDEQKGLTLSDKSRSVQIKNKIELLKKEIDTILLSNKTTKKSTEDEKEVSLTRATEDAEIKLIENAEERDIKARNKSFDRLKKDTEAKKTNKEDYDKWLTAQKELLEADLDAIDAKHEKIRTDKEKKDRDDEIKGKTEAYQKAENDKLLVLLDSTKTQEEVEEALLEFQIEQLEKKIEEWKRLYPKLGEQINQMEIDLAKKKRKRDKGTVDDVIDLEKLREDAIVLMTDVFIKKADERIAKLNEEIAAHKKQADFLKQLAISGNIQAKESLAEENRLIAESEAKKAEEEKRKQRILMVSAVLKAYIANIDAGDGSGEALAKAIASKAVLDQFVAGIGSFFEGTEDTGTVSNGLDSNGGRMAILHNNERVLTAKQNKQIGGYSNDQVANIVEQNRLGKLAGNTKMSSVWDSQLVVDQLLKVESKLDAVNTTIANKEVSSVELGAITQASMNIVERRKKAGNRTISTYKVKG